ncbi:MAG: hypothetical protein DRJ66_02500 [Thermoprotei archaeon]|nr:MAG: hypothetical protein DRJ66_02500 [Thermoprotei archaeon]RLF20902.1 MAG: hypothetical protein DRZ82_00425 [Thermoprotei archaeon]
MSEVLEETANFISELICRRIGFENIYFVGVRLDKIESVNNLHIIEVNVTLETRPFVNVDVDETVFQALEEGMKFARRRFEERGIKTRLWSIH